MTSERIYLIWNREEITFCLRNAHIERHVFVSLILSTRVHTELFTALGTRNGNR